MSASFVSRYAVGSSAVVASVVALILSLGAGSTERPQQPMPQERVAEAPRFVGDAPLPLPESATVVLQTTPDELARSIVEARGRRDLAALARCSSTSSGRAGLDQLDAARAERDFFDGDALWRAFESASKERILRVEDTKVARGDEGVEAAAEWVFPNALPNRDTRNQKVDLVEIRVALVRIRGAWFVRVSP